MNQPGRVARLGGETALHSRTMSIIITIALTQALWSGTPNESARQAARPSPKRLAVLLVSTGGLKPSLGDDLTEAFISGLSAKGGFRITGKEEVKAAIGRGEKGVLECLKSPLCLTTVGTTLGVKRMAVGTLAPGSGGKGFQARLMLVDVVSGKILHRIALEIQGGPQELLSALLKAAPKLVNPPPPKVHLKLDINVDGATVAVDGKEVQLTSAGVVENIEPGKHVIEVTKRGYAKQRMTLTLSRGEKRTVSVGLVKLAAVGGKGPAGPSPWYERWWVWTIVAGAVAAAVGVAVPLAVYEKDAPRGTMGTVSYP